jgi:hypothetical protein
MADQFTGLLLELYETQQATAYSNLVVGIVFGEGFFIPRLVREMMAHRRTLFF